MKKILIIDDDFEIREILNLYLSNSNYKTELAESLIKAEEKVISCSPDIILLDMHLPDGQGIDFLKRLKEMKITV